MRKAFSFVGVRGFEPPASSSRTTRANRAALHPEVGVGVGLSVGVDQEFCVLSGIPVLARLLF